MSTIYHKLSKKIGWEEQELPAPTTTEAMTILHNVTLGSMADAEEAIKINRFAVITEMSKETKVAMETIKYAIILIKDWK